jgi:hypothetical protein
MAPVKPTGTDQPKTKPGVTGFHQEYNQAPSPVNDLNPDVVTDASVLPKPQAAPAKASAKVRKPRGRK